MLQVDFGKVKPAARRNGFVCFPPLFDIKLVPKQDERPGRHST